MISTTGKAMLTGLVFGGLGVGLGGVWAMHETQPVKEPMARLVHPGPLAVEVPAGSEAPQTPPSVERAAQEITTAPPPVGAQPVAKAPEPQGEDSTELAIKRLVVTDRIEGREPAGDPELRADGTQVFAFVEVSSKGADAQQIEIVFEHESGQQVGFVKLPVPKDSQRWRTWGKTQQIKRSGRWVAKVRSETGAELMRRDFVVGQS